MIDPTQSDVGRAVIYRGFIEAEPERGVITSFNDKYVFVRYGAPGTTSAATARENLQWEMP